MLGIHSLNRQLAAISLGQLALGGSAVTLAILVDMPILATVSLAVLTGGLLVISRARQPKQRQRGLVVAWFSTLAIPAVFAPGDRSFTPDAYFCVLAWINAANALLAARTFLGGWSRIGANALVLLWLFAGAFNLLAVGYLQNRALEFYLGLLVVVGLLAVVAFQLRMRPISFQAILTLLLLLISLPLADLLYRPAYESGKNVELSRKYYSYKAARKDPAAFACWWRYYLQEWNNMGAEVFVMDYTGRFPFHLRPDSRGTLFKSRIRINHRGFRGPEIPDNKGNTYRIVALGESTTFGCTMSEDDKPWPELLEQLIRERLRPHRPVEVINAGVPAYNVTHSVKRMTDEILPLKPDLIITYHGVNGMRLLDEALPRNTGTPPPAFRPRPLRLLADCEYRAKMLWYRQRDVARLILQPPKLTDPLNSRYADAYRDLILIAKTNHIRLALGNFSLAVNQGSGLDVAEFYRTCAPAVHWFVRANSAHTTMLEQLTASNPEVKLVNTNPKLDGHHELFIDVAHMTKEGRTQLAENFYAGLREILVSDLDPEGQESGAKKREN